MPNSYRDCNGVFNVYEKQRQEGTTSSRNDKAKPGLVLLGLLILTIIITIVVLIIKWISGVVNEPSQYEKDLNNGLNKTWDEMTPDERDAVTDFIKWEVENKLK